MIVFVKLLHLPDVGQSISGAAIFIFLLSGVIFLTSIYYTDQAAQQLESSGIYSKSDLTYTSGKTRGEIVDFHFWSFR